MKTMGRTHASHPEHALELKNTSKPYICNGCKEKGIGKRYRCEQCDFDLHEVCMFTMPATSHEFYPKSTLRFFDQPPKLENGNDCQRFCNACRKRVRGFVYHCKEYDVDLHPSCCNLENELDINGVKFHLHGTVLSECMWCHRTSIPNSPLRIKGWSYISECEKYHFHVSCIAEVAIGEFNEEQRGERDLNAERKRPSTAAKISWKIGKLILESSFSLLLGDLAMELLDSSD